MRAFAVIVVLACTLAYLASGAVVKIESKSRRSSHQLARKRDVALVGCPSVDFSAPVTVGGQTFDLIVDTGSSTLAVASSTCNCGTSSTFSGSLSGSLGTVTSQYGDGSSWTGDVVIETVTVGGLSTNMYIAAITSQSSFFNGDCNGNTPGVNQGIMGMAFNSLAVTTSNGISTQSFPSAAELSGDGISGTVSADPASGGNPALPFSLLMCDTSGYLILGEDDTTLYTGSIEYTPITSDVWYVVNVDAMYILPAGTALSQSNVPSGTQIGASTDFQNTVKAGYGGSVFTIVDSGTTQLVVPSDVLNALENAVTSGIQSIFGQSASTFFSSNQCLTSSKTTAEINALLPPLRIDLGTSGSLVQLVMPAVSSYISQYGSGNSVYYCSGISAGSGSYILGWSVMNNFYVHFDRSTTSSSTGQVGFAATTSCSDAGGQGYVYKNGFIASSSATSSTSAPAVTYSWNQVWSICSKVCGGGQQTATLQCVNSQGVVQSSTTPCANIAKPATTRSCNLQACPSPSISSTNPSPVATGEATSPSSDSCQLRCGTYSVQASCQCDSSCTIAKDCCPDLTTVCSSTPTTAAPTVKATTAPGTPTPASAKATASPTLCVTNTQSFCGVYSPTRSCQCDILCPFEGDCCSDYTQDCSYNVEFFDTIFNRRNATGLALNNNASGISISFMAMIGAAIFVVLALL